MERNERPGRMVSGFAYKNDEWRERGIRAKRFLPCPHCGSVVSGRERSWWPAGATEAAMVFRTATCVNRSCGWSYRNTGGGREEFIEEVNRRCKTDSAGGFDGAAKEEETTCRSCSKQATSGRRDIPARRRR